MFAKIDVNGETPRPLVRVPEDGQTRRAGLGGDQVELHPEFLVDREGKVVERYAPKVEPEAIAAASTNCFSVSMFAPHWRAIAAALAVLLSRAIAAAVAAGARRGFRPRCCASRSRSPRQAFDPRGQRATPIRTMCNRAIFDPLYKYDHAGAAVQARAQHRGGVARNLGRPA